MDVPDVWTRVVLFLSCKDALRVRTVSRSACDGFDGACRVGPGQVAKVGLIQPRNGVLLTAACALLCRAVRAHTGAPLWLRFVRDDHLVTVLAWGGCLAALDAVAQPPFSCAATGSTTHNALRWAAENGHAVVVDRLARPPFSMGPEDARAVRCLVLRVAIERGHAAVVDRLALPPYFMGNPEAMRALGPALLAADEHDHVAVLDRLARPPYSLRHEDLLVFGRLVLREAAARGCVAVMDRLALPPYNCSVQQDAGRPGAVALFPRAG